MQRPISPTVTERTNLLSQESLVVSEPSLSQSSQAASDEGQQSCWGRFFLPSLQMLSRAAGFCMVQYSMFGQAFWGMAYVDLNTFEGWAQASRSAADGNTWGTAAVGKGVLVYSFTDRFWTNPISGIYEKINPLNWSALDIPIFMINLFMSCNFGGLFLRSSIDGAVLLQEIGKDWLAEHTKNPWYLGSGALAAVIGNTLGWTFIVNDAMKITLSPVTYGLQNPKYRQTEESHRAQIEAVRLWLKNQRRSERSARERILDEIDFLGILSKCFPSKHPVDEESLTSSHYEEAVRDFYKISQDQPPTAQVLKESKFDVEKVFTFFEQNSLPLAQPRSMFHKSVLAFFFVACLAICGFGFSNFYEIGGIGFSALADFTDPAFNALARSTGLEILGTNIFKVLIPVAKPVSLAAIYAMSISVVTKLTKNIGDVPFSYQQSDRVRSMLTYILAATIALYVTGLGATPNMEQSRLTGQGVEFQVLAGVAPVTIEWLAFFMLLLNVSMGILSILGLFSKHKAVTLVDDALANARDDYPKQARHGATAPNFWRPCAEPVITVVKFVKTPLGDLFKNCGFLGDKKKPVAGKAADIPDQGGEYKGAKETDALLSKKLPRRHSCA